MVDALEQAVAAIDAAKVPSDLREIAFKAVLAEVGLDSSEGKEDSASVRAGRVTDQAGTSSNGVLAAVAAKLGVDESQAAQVFDVDDDGIHLTIQRSRLDAKQKVAQQEIARLVVAARQAGGMEEWTPIGLVIDAAHDRGVHDSNFSRNVGALDGDGIRFRGAKTKRELKMNQVGFEKAAKVVGRITEPVQ